MGSKGSMESWGQGTGLSPLVSPNQAPHVLSNQDPSLVMSMQPPRHVQSVLPLGLCNQSHLVLSNPPLGRILVVLGREHSAGSQKINLK